MESPQQQQDDDDEETDPIKILLPDTNNNNELQLSNKDQRHYIIPSINSTLVIRQLPSQGLSFQLWPAATTLFTLLVNYSNDRTTGPLSSILAPLLSNPTFNILELGSGTGLVGIAAAVTLGANVTVTVTDLPHVIPNLQFNVDANAVAVALKGGAVTVATLRWGEEGNGDVELIGKDFDVIIGSDVVYYNHLYEPLLYTLRLVMGEKKRKVFVMAHLRRWKKDSVFFKRAKKFFNVEVIHVDTPFEGSRIGVVVYCFSPKGQKLLA